MTQRLSQPMRDAIERAIREPLRRVHDDKPGKPPWPAHPNTLRAGVDRGLLAHDRRRNRRGWWFDEWTPTDAGRAVLQPTITKWRGDRPLYLAQPGPNNGDYTLDRHKAIDDLEAISTTDLNPAWRRAANLDHETAKPAARTARQLGRQARRAA